MGIGGFLAAATDGVGDATNVVAGAGRFDGVVKSLKERTPDGKPAFGFVSSEQAMAAYGDDVFLHSSQVEQLQVGMKVSFEVKVNAKGRPQATNIEIVG